MQSTCSNPDGPHVAIILDGNGRWAVRRGRPRTEGHRAGAAAVRRAVEAALEEEVGVLTLFAFSADNWQRPTSEVEALMLLFKRFLKSETDRLIEHGVRLNIIGRRDRLASSLLRAIALAEERTADGSRLLLRIAVDYSGQQTLARAAVLAGQRPRSHDLNLPTPESNGAHDVDRFAAALERACHSVPGVPLVDLLIRTSGEQRLSDFLLWESAYAELHFTQTLWPDFDGTALRSALAELELRDRRFGRLPVASATACRPTLFTGRSASR